MTKRCAGHALVLPLSLTWLAFSLRIYRLDYQSLWRDEVDAIRFATRTVAQLLAAFVKHGENGPLFFLALRPWLTITGTSEFALRFPSAVAGALAVPVIYVLVRRLAGRGPAMVTALLSATAPYLVWYGQEGKMYAALTLLVPLSLWLTLQAVQRGRWWAWVLLYIVTSLCFYLHLLAVLIVPVQALWLLIVPAERAPWKRWLGTAGYLAALLLPYLPLIRWQTKMWLSPAGDTGYPFVPLVDIYRVLAVAFARGIQPATPIMLLPAMVAVIAGVILWATAKPTPGRWRVVIMLLIWLLLPPLELFAISLRRPIFTDRYLIWVSPAFLALAGLGTIAIARLWHPLGRGLSAVLVVAILGLNLTGLWGQAHQPIKSDYRSAVRFVLAHQQEGDAWLFQIPYSRHPFSYYVERLSGMNGTEQVATSDVSRMVEGPYTNRGMDEATLAAEMAASTAGLEGIWLIASEVPMWDARGMTQAWLEDHGQVTDRAEFARVAVTRYQLTR